MEHIERFFECLLPTTQCNIACEYCYIIQEKRRGMKQIPLDYSINHIKKALTKERLGGTCLFSICGTGETFLQKECVPLIIELLKEGHFVNVTTNGTITFKIEELMKVEKNLLQQLHFSFSFHYLELKKRNLIDTFFFNVDRVRHNGCSFVIQLNLYDGYENYLDEIKQICLKRVGAMPQVAATRLEPEGDVVSDILLHTNHSYEEYKKLGQSFNSSLFDFTMDNFNVKRKEFCYAGEWAFNLNLKDGNLKACYHSGKIQNIFENIEKPIAYEAVGKCCQSVYCINSSHFLSLGCIPALNTPSYAELRNRPEAMWYNEKMQKVLCEQFKNTHVEYSFIKKIICNIREASRLLKRKFKKWIEKKYGIK